MEEGILTLLPIFSVLDVSNAYQTNPGAPDRRTVVAYIIICGWSFPTVWTNAFFDVASNRDHQWVFVVCDLALLLISSGKYHIPRAQALKLAFHSCAEWT